jgi:hypothetical protein
MQSGTKQTNPDFYLLHENDIRLMIGVLFVWGRERCVASLNEKEVDTAAGQQN